MNKRKYSILLVLVVIAAGLMGLFWILQPSTDSTQLLSHQPDSMEISNKKNVLDSTRLSKKNKLIQTVLDIRRFQILSKPPYLRRFPKIFYFVTDKSDSTSHADYNLFDDIELTKMETVEGKDLEFTPCFEVFILSYSEEHAEL